MNLPLLHTKNDDHPVVSKKKKLSLGDRAADHMTEWMGSWSFIIIFAVIISIWIGLNIYGWWKHWDPYPFILLNLALSTISAFQAPVIMMSQNRQADRDRVAAKYDYAVNRKTEREVADIQEDLDEIKTMLQKIGGSKLKK
jgi:uncharacterized membrane protein